MAPRLHPLIITVTDTRKGTSYVVAFDESPILIGRGDDALLQLGGSDVALHHAKIEFDEVGVLYTDLDPRNGSLVDGVLHARGEEVDLSLNSDVRIGSFSLSFSRGAKNWPHRNGSTPPLSSLGTVVAATSAFADSSKRIVHVGASAEETDGLVSQTRYRDSSPVPQIRAEWQKSDEVDELDRTIFEGDKFEHQRSAPLGLAAANDKVDLERTIESTNSSSGMARTQLLPGPELQADGGQPRQMARTQILSEVESKADRASHAQPDLPKAGTLPVGTLLGGRYRLQGLIGQGGMGTVYKAHDESLDVPVAIKTLGNAHELTRQLLERFFREAQVIRAVSHPNIVVVHDVGRDGDLPFIAMELLKGEDLGAAIARSPLEVSEAVDIILGVCAGLQAAHERGLVHRDLKPQNIFLSKAWRVQDAPKILDFGISKTSTSKLTKAGAIMGTEHYLSPEQALDSNAVDARSDIYALGIILYECLTQRPPHSGSNVYMVIKNIVDGNFTPLREVRPDIPESFAAIIHRAMAMQPSDRFNSAHDLARELLPYASPRGQRMWSDHYSTLPPEDPMMSGPRQVRPVQQPIAPVEQNPSLSFNKLVGGTVVLSESAKAPNTRQADPHTPSSLPKSSSFEKLVGGTRLLPEESRVDDKQEEDLYSPSPGSKQGTRVSESLPPVSPPSHTMREVAKQSAHTKSRRALWAVLLATALTFVALVVLLLLRVRDTPPSPAAVPDRPTTETSPPSLSSPAVPAPSQPAPAPADLGTQPERSAAAAGAGETPPQKPKEARSRKRKIRYNVDGIPLVQ